MLIRTEHVIRVTGLSHDSLARVLRHHGMGTSAGVPLRWTLGRILGVVLFHTLRDMLGVNVFERGQLLRYLGAMTDEALEAVLTDRHYLLVVGKRMTPTLHPAAAVEICDQEHGEYLRRNGVDLTAVDVLDVYRGLRQRLREVVAQPERTESV